MLLILTPRLGKRLTELHAHGVETLEDPLLPLGLYLPHVAQRLPHPPAVLLLDPLLQPFASHQVKYTVLQPQHENVMDHRIENKPLSYLVSTPEVDRAFRNVEGNSFSVTIGEATSFWRSSISSG